MTRAIEYTNAPGVEGAERDLAGIKNAADWLAESFDIRKKEMNIEEAGPELVAILDDAISKIKVLLEKLNVDISKSKLDSLRLYLMEDESIAKYAAYIVEHDKMIINKKNISSNQEALHALTHEIYHALSVGAIRLVQHPVEEDEDNIYLNKTKLGYSSSYSFIKKINIGYGTHKRNELFKALNEGVTDMLTWLTLYKEESPGHNLGYPKEVEMVFSISSKVYGGGKSKTFLHNYFSGKMMHLKKVEKFYGKGSLMILASLNTESNYEKEFKKDKEALAVALKFRDEAIEFFTTDDEVRREELRKHILGMYN